MNPVLFLRSTPRFNLVLALLWMAFIFLLSSTPAIRIPPQLIPYSTLVHLLEYIVLGFLILPYFSHWRNPFSITVLFALLYGVSDEFHQLFVPGRFCTIDDVLVDTLGSAVGAFISKKWGGL
ncbi:MAG: VanZ family protein [Candidatus Altiarchaeota archaeon]